MYRGVEVIAVVPARGGSKGIPGKNLIDLAGYPLIYWTLSAAKKSSFIDRIVVSSDADEILEYAQSLGMEILKRPDEYATDSASSVGVLNHVLSALDIKESNKVIVFLQPTSPLRTSNSIDKAIEEFSNSNTSFLLGVGQLEKSPYHMYTLNGGNLIPIYDKEVKGTRRQDLPMSYYSNGAIYITTAKHFSQVQTFRPNEMRAFVMNKVESIDIDNFEDLDAARQLIDKEDRKP